MARAYYNEIDPHCAQWLRNLIDGGLIAHGDVDNRSIRDVSADDVKGYAQCHFFAGIGLWSYALRLAGWPDSRPVWTGSCPCQPFSNAGAGKGTADDRHLWPNWYRLIRQHRPTVLFGEQVASAVRFGWYDAVAYDLESSDYAIGAAVLQALSVGAPHRRERLYFVARREAVADSYHHRPAPGCPSPAPLGHGRTPITGSWDRVPSDMGDASSAGLAECESNSGDVRKKFEALAGTGDWADSLDYDCADGKRRRVKSGIRLVVNGSPSDVVVPLSALGNAIVPQVAAAFITAAGGV